MSRMTLAVRPRRLRRLLALTAFGAILAGTGTVWATDAHADDPGCETILWGFLGSQRRTICDSPVFPDGSWNRARVVWVPAHQVPLRTSCYGTYSFSCTTTGGYFVDEQVVSAEKYPVTPGTVLPDEPGHLAGGVVVAR